MDITNSKSGISSRKEIEDALASFNLKLDAEQVNLLVDFGRLPSEKYEKDFSYKGFIFTGKKRNIKNRRQIWIDYYKLLGKFNRYLKEYGQESGVIIFILENDNAEKTIKYLVDGDYSEINFKPETDEEILELQYFIMEIMTDFFVTTRILSSISKVSIN